MRDKKEGFSLANFMKKAAWTAVWLALWAAAAGAVNRELLLPGPAAALGALAQLAATGGFYLAVLWTAGRCAAAMCLSVGLGVAFGWLASRFRWVRDAMALPVAMFKAVPVMALAIYVILLVSSGAVGVVVCFFMCFPLVYANVLEGFSAVDKGLREVTEIYDISGAERLRLLEMPTVMPYLRAAVGLVAGISWKAVVAAEVLSLPAHSLGGAMISAKHYLDTAQLFAYIFVIVVLSLCLEKLIKRRMGAAAQGPQGYGGSRVLGMSAEELGSLLHRCAAGDGGGRTGALQPRGSAPPTVIFDSVSKAFSGDKVLDGFSMVIEAGEHLSLCGPSGRGKTTAARLLSGLEKADFGEVRVEPLCPATYLFQEDRLFPWLNSFDNMAMGLLFLLREAGSEGGAQNAGAAEGAIQSAAAKRALAERILGLACDLEIAEEETLWALPGELSGGMAHRVALGRTFAAGRSLVVLDEPFRGLDEELKNRVLERLWERETKGKTLMLITHSEKDAASLAERSLEI